MKIWLDGTLAVNRTPSLPSDRSIVMNFSGSGWQAWQFYPIWGGVGDAKAQDDFLWVDHTHISAP